MPTLIAGVVAIIVLYSLLQMFRAANPAVLARVVKIVGGVLALAVAAFTGLKGELVVAIPLGIFGAGLLGWSPFGTPGFGNIGAMFGGGTQRSAGQSSRVRSQFLDMSLDHDSGQLRGQIVDGPSAGHSLDGRGGLSDPWPAAGRDARRHQPGAPRPHEETPSRPRGVDVPRRPCKRGQGHSLSHASQLTPATLQTLRTASCFCS
jgi:hypothetical protein